MSLGAMRFQDLASNIMFINSEVLDGDIPNLVDFFRMAIDGVFVETDQFFRFRINPQSMTVRKGKIIAKTFTKTGYTYSHHGNEQTMLEYRGTTGFFEQPNVAEVAAEVAKVVPGFPADIQDAERLRDQVAQLLFSGRWNLTNSPVWQKFRRFERFWDRVQSEMMLYYDLRLYRGQVTNFGYTEDSNDPFQIKYQFSFEAHTDTSVGSDRFGRGLIHLGVR